MLLEILHGSCETVEREALTRLSVVICSSTCTRWNVPLSAGNLARRVDPIAGRCRYHIEMVVATQIITLIDLARPLMLALEGWHCRAPRFYNWLILVVMFTISLIAPISSLISRSARAPTVSV